MEKTEYRFNQNGKIVVCVYHCKPIPDRNFDWCAYEDGGDETVCGYGETPHKALQDFNEIVFQESMTERLPDHLTGGDNNG